MSILFEHRMANGKGQRIILLLAAILASTLIALLIILNVTHRTSRVTGVSMYPTLHLDDVLLVTRGSYSPGHGDVVLIGRADKAGILVEPALIKRVIAIGGDTVRVDAGRAYVNGDPEQPAHSVIYADDDISYPEHTLHDDEIFVLGDNRPLSRDSRMYGPLDINNIQGEVVAIITPLNRLGTVR